MKTSEVIDAYRAGRMDIETAIQHLKDNGHTPDEAAYLLCVHGIGPASTWLYVLGAAFVMGLWLWLYFGPLNY